MSKSYVLTKFYQFSDEKSMEAEVNTYLQTIQDQGYTVISVQLAMAGDRAHQVLIVYSNK